ncbi:hypothetical protein WDZ92_36830, partial [Nostoc sp. NIES-2111]
MRTVRGADELVEGGASAGASAQGVGRETEGRLGIARTPAAPEVVRQAVQIGNVVDLPRFGGHNAAPAPQPGGVSLANTPPDRPSGLP